VDYRNIIVTHCAIRNVRAGENVIRRQERAGTKTPVADRLTYDGTHAVAACGVERGSDQMGGRGSLQAAEKRSSD